MVAAMVSVYLVEESPHVARLVAEALTATGLIRVAGVSADPFVAWEELVRHPVDVLLLDAGLRRFDSLTFFRYLLDSCPLPTVLMALPGKEHDRIAIEALRYGAVSIWLKRPPADGALVGLDELVAQVLAGSRVERSRLAEKGAPDYVPDIPSAGDEGRDYCRVPESQRLIAVGGSTGAVAAMQTMFGGFGPDFPPTVAVIHLPEGFTATFARQLAAACPVKVKEAEDGEIPLPGHVYIAPGNRHLIMERRPSAWAMRLIGGPRVFFQRPSVDVLFHSVADVVGRQAVGVLLTGMGKDGAEGLLRMRQCGAHTITQDEASSVVYGMPREAVAIGGSCQSLPLDRIAAELRSRVC